MVTTVQRKEQRLRVFNGAGGQTVVLIKEVACIPLDDPWMFTNVIRRTSGSWTGFIEDVGL